VPPPPAPAAGSNFYSSTKGSVIDVATDAASVDVAVLLSSGCFILLAQVGPTSARPTYPKAGQMFVDTTIGAPLWFDGTAWRDATGTSH
jgi:hypothetical protein